MHTYRTRDRVVEGPWNFRGGRADRSEENDDGEPEHARNYC
jgi:hypothetical protein